MPENGVVSKKHSDILSYEEMLSVIKQCAEMGINRIRLTGGEPLVRKGIVDFIYKLNNIAEIEQVNLTTNGVLLAQYAEQLKKAGISNINISLDTLKEERFEYITRCGKLKDVLRGIYKALETGFDKIKLNIVVIRGFNDDELADFINLTKDNPLYVRFIELMPIGEAADFKDGYISCDEIRSRLPALKEAFTNFSTGPANYYSIDGHKGLVGFINPVSNCFCEKCNRIRLTADGKIIPCLHSDREVDIKTVIREGNTDKVREAVMHTIELKPEKHSFSKTCSSTNKSDNQRYMSQVGG